MSFSSSDYLKARTRILQNVSRETFECFEIFAEMLVKWNAKINLVSKKDIDNLWTRHILDCVGALKELKHLAGLHKKNPDKQKPTIVDVGTGAGLPGMILSIATGEPIILIEKNGYQQSIDLE